MTGGEARYKIEPAGGQTPEQCFQRDWATTLLDHVLGRLRAEYMASGKEQEFLTLKVFLAGRNPEISYATAGGELGMSAGAATVAAHRLRRRYAELLRKEIADTLSDTGDVEDEIHNLFKAFGS